MKGSCALVASVLVASTVALSSSTSLSSSAADGDVAFYPWSSYEGGSNSSMGKNGAAVNPKTCSATSSDKEKEKFAPRFDGLRFIKTLITAHR